MEKTRSLKSYQILNKAFLAKKQRNSAYSQRALARDLAVSAAFVTKVLTGKKTVPHSRLQKVFQILDMDITLQAAYMRATVLESMPSPELRKMAESAFAATGKMEVYARETSHKFAILRQWYNVPILTYLSSEDLDSSPAAIAAYFGISEKEVLQSLQGMEKAELVQNKNGAWIKISQHSYFPTTKSQEEVRHYHREMIQKAHKELSKTSAEDFEKRMITGFSIAVNPENMDRAKKMIVEFMGEISHVLSDGPCADVYQCNVQLFPMKAGKSS